MEVLEDGMKATESRVFVLDQFDAYSNIDIEGTCSNLQSTVTYVCSLHSSLKNNKALP